MPLHFKDTRQLSYSAAAFLRYGHYGEPGSFDGLPGNPGEKISRKGTKGQILCALGGFA